MMRSLVAGVLALSLGAAALASADDAPVVHVRDGQLHPAALVVHVGEIVRWQPPPGQSVRVELDRHPSAHEVAERAGDVRAIFRRAGEHHYRLTLLPAGQRFVGTVAVREGHAPAEPSVCADGSSEYVCFLP